MNRETLKKQAAIAAIEYIEEGTTLGVGTGSTVHYFIEALANSKVRNKLKAVVASSLDTEQKLKALKIPVFDLNVVDELTLYVDGADAFNAYKQLIKGSGGALTREKILASAAKSFICIVDDSKQTTVLGTSCPVPIEVIPMARSFVAREIVKLGGDPVYRQPFKTDNGNIILDIHHWVIAEPIKLERTINNIPGVVCNGLFADKTPDLILISKEAGVSTF